MNVQRIVCVNVYGFNKIRNGLTNVGEQDIPPQNMPIWYKDYFRLITFKKQHT